MKRRLGILAASAMLVTVGVFAPASPASADTDLCGGTGGAGLSTGFGLPLVTSNTASFDFAFFAGTCLPVPVGKGPQFLTRFATGTVTGACGLSTGSGVTVANGHTFSFLSTGTLMVITGQLTGVAFVTVDPLQGGSCTNKTASFFRITGVVALQHCTLVQALPTVGLPWGNGTVHICVG